MITTVETAKLAKEKGFDLICQYYYEILDNPVTLQKIPNSNAEGYVQPSAPDQSELQTWLRNKGVMVEVTFYTCDDGVEYSVEVCHEKTWDTKSEFTKDTFKSYEKALERGLQEGLKLL